MTGIVLRLLGDVSLRSAAAIALVGVVLAVFRVRASAVRHAAWAAALIAMLLMPMLPSLVPAIAVPLPEISAPVTSDAPVAHDFSRAAQERRDARQTPDALATHDLSRAPQEFSRVVSGFSRTDLALVLYVLVAASMLLRFFVGWWGAARITRASERVTPPSECLNGLASSAAIDIRESRAVAIPVTVGVLRPAILLPVAWTRWPHEKLRAVLAHEIAHVRRRDVSVAFLAHLNRCLFWFHPLSWWLERTLATCAEQASDEEAIAALGARAVYAATLLDMARAVGDTGGRVQWLGVGIDGSGQLAQRIDRALNGNPAREMPAVRKAIVAAACIGAIVIAAACRPSAAAIPENASLEQRDHALRIELERLRRALAGHFDTVDWSADPGVAARDADVRAHPDDLDALQRFLISYWAQYAQSSSTTEHNPLVANKVVDGGLLAARRERILWLIDHHPESDLAGAVEARIFQSDLSGFFPGDPHGYGQAKLRWLAQTAGENASARVLGNAAAFFEIADQPLAEQLLVRARARDPQGPWTARLGRFYRDVLVGSWAWSGRNSLRQLVRPDARSPFGLRVRATLAESVDEPLLIAAGWSLSGFGGPRLDFDPDAWAEACLTRALQLNPQSILAHSALLNLRQHQQWAREPLLRVAPADQDAHLAVLLETERFDQLPELARNAYLTVADSDRWNDPNLRGRLDLARSQASRYAEDTLRLAPKYRDRPGYGAAIYTANMTLSALAWHDGDRRKALEYLDRASRAPASEDLTYGDAVVSRWWFTRELIATGERKPMIDFLERMARINVAGRIDLREQARALRSQG